MKFIIFAPPFNEKNGGSIVLHKLCDLINSQGYESYIFPMFENNEISPLNWASSTKATVLQQLMLEQAFKINGSYRLCERYNTKVFQGNLEEISNSKDIVVVYPEITFGNPLGAKNVSRWILNEPGFISGKIYYTHGEVQFRFSEQFNPIVASHLEISPVNLFVIDVPWHYYDGRGGSEGQYLRKGAAYLIKKGKGRKVQHDLDNSVCIDGMNHQEISDLFKKVQYFFSYDFASMYSSLASISGVISVILPLSPGDPRQTTEDPIGLNGVAFGMNDIPRALSTVEALREELKMKEAASVRAVAAFTAFWRDRLNQ